MMCFCYFSCYHFVLLLRKKTFMNGNSVNWWYRVALSLLAVTAFLPLIQFSDGRVVTLMAPNFAAITLTSVITMAVHKHLLKPDHRLMVNSAFNDTGCAC